MALNPEGWREENRDQRAEILGSSAAGDLEREAGAAWGHPFQSAVGRGEAGKVHGPLLQGSAVGNPIPEGEAARSRSRSWETTEWRLCSACRSAQLCAEHS